MNKIVDLEEIEIELRPLTEVEDLKTHILENGGEIPPNSRKSLLMELAMGFGTPLDPPLPPSKKNQILLHSTRNIPVNLIRPDSSYVTLYADSFPANISEEEFLAIFQSFARKGKIMDCKYKVHVSGAQTGFGFVTFSSKEDALQAIDVVHGKQIENQIIRVTFSNPPYHRTSNTNLYIEKVPLNWDEERLERLFNTYGEIKAVNLLLHKQTCEKTGVAFVHYKTNSEAQLAIDNLNGKNPLGCSEPLIVRFAKMSKSSRKWNSTQASNGTSITSTQRSHPFSSYGGIMNFRRNKYASRFMPYCR